MQQRRDSFPTASPSENIGDRIQRVQELLDEAKKEVDAIVSGPTSVDAALGDLVARLNADVKRLQDKNKQQYELLVFINRVIAQWYPLIANRVMTLERTGEGRLFRIWLEMSKAFQSITKKLNTYK